MYQLQDDIDNIVYYATPIPNTLATNRERFEEQTESNDTLSTSRLNTIIKVHKTSFNL